MSEPQGTAHTTPRPLIGFLPSRQHGKVSVNVDQVAHVGFLPWHQLVHLPFIQPDATRLDRYWHWPRFAVWRRGLERALGRTTTNFCFNVVDRNGKSFPIAAMLVADGYPYMPDRTKSCVFVWYLTAAPKSALEANGIQPVKTLRAMLDVAIQHSFNLGFDGRILLHAARAWHLTDSSNLLEPHRILARYRSAPVQDAELVAKYIKAGLRPVPVRGWWERIPLARPGRRNDGRYLHCDEITAMDLSKKMDYLR